VVVVVATRTTFGTLKTNDQALITFARDYGFNIASSAAAVVVVVASDYEMGHQKEKDKVGYNSHESRQ